MENFNLSLLIYTVPAVTVILLYVNARKTAEMKSAAIKKEEFDAGLTQPATLHPLIDPAKCLGCKACVEACPEQNVLGVINGKAELIAPTHCIGHGACQEACPTDAIELVFGTEKRGVDIPVVHPNFETNVPNIFIAGELGGMGLIKNAVEQGRQAIDFITQRVSGKKQIQDALDVVIVGAGPAGLSATLGAVERKLDYVTLERESIGGAIFQYPRGKIVMTQPANLPIVGKVKFKETTKDRLLEFWKSSIERANLKINECEGVQHIRQDGEYLFVVSSKGEYKTKTVLLAVGRRGIPRKLGVAGEELSKVVYRLIDPAQYRGLHVLIVGGGDSALEAAIAISEVAGTQVHISYRSESFSRAKQKNRDRLVDAQKSGNLKVWMSSQVKEICEKQVVMVQGTKEEIIENDAVIVCAGGILPTQFLNSIGVKVETKYGTA